MEAASAKAGDKSRGPKPEGSRPHSDQVTPGSGAGAPRRRFSRARVALCALLARPALRNRRSGREDQST